MIDSELLSIFAFPVSSIKSGIIDICWRKWWIFDNFGSFIRVLFLALKEHFPHRYLLIQDNFKNCKWNTVISTIILSKFMISQFSLTPQTFFDSSFCFEPSPAVLFVKNTSICHELSSSDNGVHNTKGRERRGRMWSHSFLSDTCVLLLRVEFY